MLISARISHSQKVRNSQILENVFLRYCQLYAQSVRKLLVIYCRKPSTALPLRPHQALLGDPAVCSIALSTPSFYSSSSSYPLKIRGSLASSNMGLQTVSKPSPVPSQRGSSN